ncbi:MAG: hypothetical protein ACE5G3_08005 [Gammaproteobacteria bacterium]
MNRIDNITVILGPPASHNEKERLAAEAEAAGASVDDIYVARIAGIVDELTARASDEPSVLDRFFSELMGRPVRLSETTPTYFEKKGKRYPAIMVAARDVVDTDGHSLEDEVTATFRKPDSNAALSERIGVRLGIESAKTFCTFGARN